MKEDRDALSRIEEGIHADREHLTHSTLIHISIPISKSLIQVPDRAEGRSESKRTHVKQKYKEDRVKFTTPFLPLCIQLQVGLGRKKETRTVGESDSRTIGDGESGLYFSPRRRRRRRRIVKERGIGKMVCKIWIQPPSFPRLSGLLFMSTRETFSFAFHSIPSHSLPYDCKWIKAFYIRYFCPPHQPTPLRFNVHFPTIHSNFSLF